MECNNYFYVGCHKGDIFKDNYYGSGLAWRNVISKYGKESIKRTVIDTYTRRVEKIELERKYIKIYKEKYGKNCLNISDGGDGGDLGVEVRKRISKAVSGERNGMYGKKLSEKSRKKISDKLVGHPNYNPKGYKHTEEAKQRIGNANRGSTHTEEAREKMRVARANQKNLTLDSAKGKHWFYNINTGQETMLFDNEVSYGWVRGRKTQVTKGKHYYTNGIEDILLKDGEVAPEGFMPGRHYKKEN